MSEARLRTSLWITREATPYGQAHAPDPFSRQVCPAGPQNAARSRSRVVSPTSPTS